MAIYSLNHKTIGKATQDAPFTAAAHIRYISRSGACREIVGDRMPIDPKQAQNWFNAEEKADRKNARICDKIMIALPRELDAEQRLHLVKDFAERVTQGKAPWLAAIHDKGKDKKNPHCHLVLRDRDTQTRKRVLHMSAGKSERALLAEKGIDAMTTERMRVIWENAANEHLELAGKTVRIDSRSLEDQGIKRKPTVHEGVKARQMTARGERPQSKVVEFSNAPTARSGGRSVDYTTIDGGSTRQEYNAQIISLSGRSSKNDEKKLVGNVKLPDNFENGRNTAQPSKSIKSHNFNKEAKYEFRAVTAIVDNAEGASVTEKAPRQSTQNRTANEGQSPPSANGRRIPSDARELSRRPRSVSSAFGTLRYGRLMPNKNLEAYLKEAESKEERLKMLKGIYRDTYEAEVSNARDHEEGKVTYEEAEKLNVAAREIRKETQEALSEQNQGREFLQKEAHEVRADVYAKDKQTRDEKAKLLEQEKAKVLEEERAREAEEASKQLPRSAEVAAEEVQPDEGKKKAAEIMAFLAAQEQKQRQQQSSVAVSNEKERKRERDNEWEPE